jgi:hypothetical protein
MRRKAERVEDTMRTEHDFDCSKAVRGKYHRRLQEEGSKVVVLDPDVAREFPTSASVNEALRSLLGVLAATSRLAARPRKLPRKNPARRRAGSGSAE